MDLLKSAFTVFRQSNFSTQKKAPQKSFAKRAISSENPVNKGPKSNFDSSLIKEYKQQMRHSDEVNSLIDQLKTYRLDFKKKY